MADCVPSAGNISWFTIVRDRYIHLYYPSCAIKPWKREEGKRKSERERGGERENRVERERERNKIKSPILIPRDARLTVCNNCGTRWTIFVDFNATLTTAARTVIYTGWFLKVCPRFDEIYSWKKREKKKKKTPRYERFLKENKENSSPRRCCCVHDLTDESR